MCDNAGVAPVDLHKQLDQNSKIMSKMLGMGSIKLVAGRNIAVHQIDS